MLMKNTPTKLREAKLNKRAFFVIGPESSGTRMMTQAFIACGCYGSGGHQQKLDKEGFDGEHELIVLRRSVPHGVKMPPIIHLIEKMQKSGYFVHPVVILRDKDKCAFSQVERGHAKNFQVGKDSIKKAINHIYMQLANFTGNVTVMHYEPFVKHKKVRDNFFNSFGFEHPDMEFYNANSKYK